MRSWIRLLFLGVLAVVVMAIHVPVSMATEILRPLEGCPDNIPTCVVMDFSLIWPGEPSYDPLNHPAVVAEDRFEGEHYSIIKVVVYGRLNGTDPENYLLFFHDDWGAMKCRDFSVPAIGLSADKVGTILTDRGTFEIVDTSFRLGCRNCVALIDKESLEVSFKISPSWSQGMWLGRLVFQINGNVYWNMGATCIGNSVGGEFSLVNSQHCVGPEPRPAQASFVKLVREARILEGDYTNERLRYDLFELEGAPFLIYVYGVACT